MKNLIILLLLGLFVSANAQTKYFETDIQGIRKDIRDVAKEIVAENMDLTPEQAQVFWPLYDEYQSKIKELGDKEVEITEQYLLNYMLMEEDIAKNLLSDVMKLNEEKLSIKNEYLNKMANVLPAKVVGKFYQIDRRIDLLIDAEKASRIPILKKN